MFSVKNCVSVMYYADSTVATSALYCIKYIIIYAELRNYVRIKSLIAYCVPLAHVNLCQGYVSFVYYCVNAMRKPGGSVIRLI